MNLCSNCQTTIIEASPYREATINEEPLEPKRSLMSRVNISPRGKRIALWSAGVLVVVGIPAYLFHGIALTILLGIVGVVGVAISAVVAWLILYLAPHMLGVWLGRILGQDDWYRADGTYINEEPGPWWLAFFVCIVLPAAASVIGWALFAFGKYIAATIHIGV